MLEDPTIASENQISDLSRMEAGPDWCRYVSILEGPATQVRHQSLSHDRSVEQRL